LPNGEAVMEVNWLLEDLRTAQVIATQQQRIGSREDYNDLLVQLAQHVSHILTTRAQR